MKCTLKGTRKHLRSIARITGIEERERLDFRSCLENTNSWHEANYCSFGAIARAAFWNRCPFVTVIIGELSLGFGTELGRKHFT